MAFTNISKLGIFLLQESRTQMLTPLITGTNFQLVRHRRTKHFNPKFKKLRKLKYISVDLPNFHRSDEDVSEEERRVKIKESAMPPLRSWNERQVSITSTGGIFEAYIPPEGDGKVSSITAQGAKQNIQFLEKKTKTMMAIRKIRSFEENFDTVNFCKSAQEIYINAHKALANKDQDKLLEYVTERAFPDMYHNVERMTIRWNFLKQIELPRIVHARCTDVITKENIFAQVTVRLHSRQLLAVYDRFGRLIQGSEIKPKDVLEYIVFEKHVANEYGVWRIHDKIIPDWLPQETTSLRTFKVSVENLTSKITEPDKAVVETSLNKSENIRN